MFMMTVKDLISKLEKINPNRRVVVRGYEEGYCDIHDISIVPLKLDVNEEWYYGPHSKEEDGEECVFLYGKNHLSEK